MSTRDGSKGVGHAGIWGRAFQIQGRAGANTLMGAGLFLNQQEATGWTAGILAGD